MMPGRRGFRRWLGASAALRPAAGPDRPAAPLGAIGLTLVTATGALAQASAEPAPAGPTLRDVLAVFVGIKHQDLFGISFFFGLLVFTITVAIFHIRARNAWLKTENHAQAEIDALRGRIDRTEALLLSEPQIIAVWTGSTEPPTVTGDLPGIDVARRTGRFAATGWLNVEDARALENEVEALRSRGEAFRQVSRARTGAFIEAEGRAIGGRAVLRLRDVTGDRLELARLAETHRRTVEEAGVIRALIDDAPLPMWLREREGRLTWVNKAYARAVDAADEAEALGRGVELLDRPAREEAGRRREAGKPYLKRVPAVVGGARRILDIIDVPSPRGSAGMAVDVSELEEVRASLERQMQAYVGTFDQIATAVAIFDADRRLTFYNAAYRGLWQLDPAFLDEKPRDGEILDRLRAHHRLPEQADFRAWKNKLHEAYRALEPASHLWHLPGNKTLRIVTTPNPAGGVIYLFEDVTERYDLEARFNAMARVQGETLDNLKEGVAAFGSDGRLRLSNPAFAAMWKLSPEDLGARPHIDAVAAICAPLFQDTEIWAALKAAITSFGDRNPSVHRMGRVDGSVIDVATVPLPDGGTLLTFTNVTDTVNFENALVDKNEALEEASRLKNAFVHHVSYELRSPLTNIIGFVQLLADGAAGPLSDKQRQYAGYIMTSSDSLLAIINNILDLATIDAGAMTLEVDDIDIRGTMQAAAEAVQPRLTEMGVKLEMAASNAIGSFEADGKRVRQVLFNLLSNAIGFSERGGTVTLTAERRGSEVLFRVEDRGKGIPQKVIDRVFDRFESYAGGTDHRGVGLGLSIVRSFVELHGGRVDLTSKEGYGTVVTCHFPDVMATRRIAAE
ncbi:sensor histidine kinase [Labrys wisconsinensis]|uniref:histidine kinase n=1 Tax=Labrys wisconsinensis TaxID=425677 RepID=A0ABU0J3Z4_9HYPH|nr:PAS-domain containing protein [Labrys wisconsinensis]MDQ0468133.1 signal transduction histidine kinase [Labrys wisconsinensis]